ncbi:MAG: EAL domain-containing protein [Cyanobacteria bacterium]|nr:EAL domain-containing protein [Cyanobacteriota bacterium]
MIAAKRSQAGMLTIAPAALVASLLVTGVTVAVRAWGGLQPWELAVYDMLSRLYSPKSFDPRLLVVAITEADIQGENRWPLSDQTLARVIARLQHYQPRVIGLDLHRNVPQPPGTDALQQQLQAKNLFTIEKLGDPRQDGIPAPPGFPKARVGFNDFLRDPDNVVRRNLLYAYQGDQQFYSLSLRLALAYLAQHGHTLSVTPNTLAIGQVNFRLLEKQSGGYHNLEAIGYQIMITPPKTIIREVTVTQVLTGDVNPAWIRDKIVLIGSTAPSLKDLFQTSYSNRSDQDEDKIPGVALHAQLVRQLLGIVLDRDPLVWYWPEWGELLWIWVAAFTGGAIAWRFRHPILIGSLGAGTIAGIIGTAVVGFSMAGWIPVVSPMLALVLTTGSVIAYRSFYETFYDSLSGLPNRTLLLNLLRKKFAAKHHAPIAILFLGLDRFEVIHNSLGHQASDQLIVEVTRRLGNLNRAHILARIGNDEFVMVLEALTDVDEPIRTAEHLHQSMAAPFVVNDQPVFTGISIGIALSQPGSDNHPEDLLRDAHTAMNRARQLGSDRHEVFAAGMRVQIVRQLQLETDLRHAIEHRQFQLYYQPIIALDTHRLAGFEALIRWHHPQHGFVSPSEFIPVSEETGLIIPLGQWTLREAGQQLKTWQQQFPLLPLTISVNLSSQQLNQPNLVGQVEDILHQVGINGQGLKLEITESAAMNDAEATIELLQRLKDLNLHLCIDDFGTGYSSLSYLHKFPVDTLKIDRSFISQMGEDGKDDTAIVQTILVLGHSLGMDVVAEGVETPAQQQILQRLGCDYGQGYLFSKPLDSTAATQLLAEHAHQQANWPDRSKSSNKTNSH